MSAYQYGVEWGKGTLLTANGETMTLDAWAQKLGVRSGLIGDRLRRGCTPEQAVRPRMSAKRKGQRTAEKLAERRKDPSRGVAVGEVVLCRCPSCQGKRDQAKADRAAFIARVAAEMGVEVSSKEGSAPRAPMDSEEFEKYWGKVRKARRAANLIPFGPDKKEAIG